MKKVLILLCAAAMASCATGRVGNKKATTVVDFAQNISVEGAKKHLTILASDEFEGRETGKPGADKAASYIAGEFKKLGLEAPVKGSYFLDVPLTENAFKVSDFTINGTALTPGKDFYSSVGYSADNTVKATEVIFLGYGISDEKYDELKNIDITGKVVIYINEGEPMKNGLSVITGTDTRSQWSLSRGKRNTFLRSKNPALILVTGPKVASNLKNFGTSIMAPSLTIKKENEAARVSQPLVLNITTAMASQLLKRTGKTYEQLKAAIDSTGIPNPQVVKADVEVAYKSTISDVKAVDVLGFLPGSDAKLKDEVLVISAHYDHIGLEPEGTTGDRINNGADDDGSGTTGVLEIANAFVAAKKAGKGPKRSILFLANVGEEKGLLGSEYYSEHPVFPLANTITDLNIDMIGRVDPAHKAAPEYCYLIGSDKLSTTLHKISETANATYTKLNIDYKFNDPNDPERIYYRSDHYNFAKHGIPIIFYFNGVHEDYHGVGDEVEKINFPLLVKRAQLVFYTGWELANRAERPVVDVKNDMSAEK